LLHPKKVGTIPVGENAEEVKQTNEIKVAAPLLDSMDIENKDITADALHTQWKFARYLVEQRKAHYHFTVKSNQPTLLNDISYYFQNSDKEPEFVDITNGEHGRIETRKIWTTTELNGYLSFPHIGQVFAIEREFVDKRTGKLSKETAYGITSRKKEEADAERILKINRGHWTIENSCHYILDWNYDEDRCRIRTGYGPENITRLRRFAISVIKSKDVYSVAQTIRRLSFNVRAVFDYLKMTKKFQTAVYD
jgi:predicted transposase YbfD/YdcC